MLCSWSNDWPAIQPASQSASQPRSRPTILKAHQRTKSTTHLLPLSQLTLLCPAYARPAAPAICGSVASRSCAEEHLELSPALEGDLDRTLSGRGGGEKEAGEMRRERRSGQRRERGNEEEERQSGGEWSSVENEEIRTNHHLVLWQRIAWLKHLLADARGSHEFLRNPHRVAVELKEG